MHSTLFFAAGLATLAHAFTQPKDQTWGPLLTPDTTNSVTQGKDFTVTWDPETRPTDGVTVSLVLCHGPGSNCVLSDTAIAEGIPASQKSFDWKVPCTLTPGVQSTATGYGLLIIVDGTGEFQYSTQFSVLENKSCPTTGGGTVTSSPVATPSSGTAPGATGSITTIKGGSTIVLGPPAYATGSSSWGNYTSTVTPTGTEWPVPAGTTWIVSTSGSVVYTYTGVTYPTGTDVSSTLTTAASAGAGSTTTSSGPAVTTSPFGGGAAHIGSSLAGMAIAGAVAVFAL